MAKYEYKFVRLGEGWFGVKRHARDDYQEEIHRYARDGWRLVQIFAPGTGGYGVGAHQAGTQCGARRGQSHERWGTGAGGVVCQRESAPQ